MKKYSFRSDYSEGAIPEIIDVLSKTNLAQSVGYGEDEYCNKAKKIIKNTLNYQDCDIHFLVGGTQTNLTFIASVLRPFEAAIAAISGHINTHETGSIEATGHKVVIADSIDGKITCEGILKVLNEHQDEHMVKPKLVYISNSTEIGTIYSKEELIALHQLCLDNDLLFFIDGARLGSALTSKLCDYDIKDLPHLCDAFYIGGTKNGALFGEALVIINNKLKKDFRFMIKQRGGMLAKGRLLGIQFATLFENDRFFQIAKHANEMAMMMQTAFEDKQIPLLIKSYTNQIFPILTKHQFNKLIEQYDFQIWETISEEQICVRFVTSWATPFEVIQTFINDLNAI